LLLHMPRQEIVIDVADKTCACCGGLKHCIGEDVAERLDVIPAQFKVIVTRRPKYACAACAGEVVQAGAPERLIENGIPTEALVAHVLVAKYADHTPLYRQAQIYARAGITLDRSTLADWVGRAAFALRPVHARLLEQLNRRRDHRAGARSRTRARQEGPAVGLCTRRAALGWPRPAGRCLCLCARPQACAAGRAPRRIQRHAAGRRRQRLCRACATRLRLLLEPCAAGLKLIIAHNEVFCFCRSIPPRKIAERGPRLGSVGIQDSHPGLVVIQAVDGPIRFD